MTCQLLCSPAPRPEWWCMGTHLQAYMIVCELWWWDLLERTAVLPENQRSTASSKHDVCEYVSCPCRLSIGQRSMCCLCCYLWLLSVHRACRTRAGLVCSAPACFPFQKAASHYFMADFWTWCGTPAKLRWELASFFFFLLNISANQSDRFAGKEWQPCSLGYKLFCQGWGGRKLLLSCCSFHPNLSSRVHLSLGLCCLLRSLYASTMQWLKRGTGALQRSCAVPRAPCCQLLLPYFTSCQCFWSCNTWS